MNHINTLKTQARQLRLSTLATNLELRLQEASSHQLPHAQFLELLLQDELNGRYSKAIARDTKAAAFREQRCLSDFDFTFNPSVPRAKVYELATCQFIGQARDVLLIGPPGVGKSHIAQSLGLEVIRHKWVRKDSRHIPPIIAPLNQLQDRSIATPRLLAHTATQHF